jgi:hypothetical protein
MNGLADDKLLKVPIYFFRTARKYAPLITEEATPLKRKRILLAFHGIQPPGICRQDFFDQLVAQIAPFH